MTRYKAGNTKDITDVLFQAKIVDFRGSCAYNRNRTEVEIELNVAFEVARGQANRDRKVAFQYFVAIPYFHPAPQGRNVFSIATQFVGAATRFRINDIIQMDIPLKPKTSRDEYAVYLGLQLTLDELKENRQ